MVASICCSAMPLGCLPFRCLSSDDCSSFWRNELAVGSGGVSIVEHNRGTIRAYLTERTRECMRTYILPTTDWAVLLPIILRDAQAGDVLEVHTREMWDLTTEMVREVGRTDLVIHFRDRTVVAGVDGRLDSPNP